MSTESKAYWKWSIMEILFNGSRVNAAEVGLMPLNRVNWSCVKNGESAHRVDSGEEIVLTLIRCPFHPRVIAVARKRPRSLRQKCRWQLHLNKHAPLTQRSRSGLIPLCRHSVGTYQEKSSHKTRQGALGHSRLSSLSHCGLILTKRVEWVLSSSSPL